MDFFQRSKDAAGKSLNATSQNITYHITYDLLDERLNAPGAEMTCCSDCR